MPTLNDQISGAEKVIQGLGALIGAVPLIALLMNLVTLPPSLSDIVKLVSFFITAVVILSVMMLRRQITQMKPGLAAALVGALVIAGAISAVAFWRFADAHVVRIERDGTTTTYVAPLHPEPNLREAVAAFGGYPEAIVSPVGPQVVRQMKAGEGSAVLTMFVLLVAANVLLVSSVVGGAWKVAGSIGAARGAKPGHAAAPAAAPPA